MGLSIAAAPEGVAVKNREPSANMEQTVTFGPFRMPHLAKEVDDRFRQVGESGESTLSFVTEEGNAFHVVNDPAGATVGSIVPVRAHRVQPSASGAPLSKQYLWII